MSLNSLLPNICTKYHVLCRLFDMGITVQQAAQSLQSLVFHPWQGSTPATAVISSGGVTDNVALAHSTYNLFQANSSDQGRQSLADPMPAFRAAWGHKGLERV